MIQPEEFMVLEQLAKSLTIIMDLVCDAPAFPCNGQAEGLSAGHGDDFIPVEPGLPTIASQEALRTDLRPIEITQPDGQSHFAGTTGRRSENHCFTPIQRNWFGSLWKPKERSFQEKCL